MSRRHQALRGSRTRSTLALWLALCLAGAACGGAETAIQGSSAAPTSPAAAETAPQTSAPQTTAPGGDASGESAAAAAWLEALTAVPDTPETRASILLVDWSTSFSTFAPLEPDSSPADAKAAVDAVNDAGLYAAPLVWPPITRLADGTERWVEAYGIPLASMGVQVEAAGLPHTIDVLRPAVSDETVVAALEADPLWSGDLQVEDRAGEPLYRWTEGCDLSRSVLPDRPKGCGGALALPGDLVVWAEDASVVEDALPAFSGQAGSLGQDPVLQSLVGRIGAAGALLGHIQLRPLARENQNAPDLAEDTVGLPRTAAHDAFGIAVASDGNELLILHHADEAQAQAGATALQEVLSGPATVQDTPIAEILDTKSIEVEGNLVVATFERAPASSQGPRAVRLFPLLTGGRIHQIFSST